MFNIFLRALTFRGGRVSNGLLTVQMHLQMAFPCRAVWGSGLHGRSLHEMVSEDCHGAPLQFLGGTWKDGKHHVTRRPHGHRSFFLLLLPLRTGLSLPHLNPHRTCRQKAQRAVPSTCTATFYCHNPRIHRRQINEIARAISIEVRDLLDEVGRLRDQRRQLQ